MTDSNVIGLFGNDINIGLMAYLTFSSGNKIILIYYVVIHKRKEKTITFCFWYLVVYLDSVKPNNKEGLFRLGEEKYPICPNLGSLITIGYT